MKRIVAAIVLAAFGLALSGCDTTTASAPGNTTLGSAAVGGLGGAAVGALASKNKGKGALIGGAVGTLGGALLGQQMEANRDRQKLQQLEKQRAYEEGYSDAQQAPPPRKY
jgi:outer membrane lipoprotein SlyB